VRLPQRVGDYTLLEQLGAGSFGTVYRARIEGDMGFSQQVAVKLVDNSRTLSRPGVITSQADEAQFLARLAHPNIVAVRRFVKVDHEFLGEAHLMEMELVRGVPLSHLLRALQDTHTRLPVDAVLSLLLEGVSALVYAHDLKDPDGRSIGLVHRDLKPDNLLISVDGRLKVLDFGIAWAEDRIAPTTATGMAKGTPHYMSPEQARGEAADPRSDLYSLAAIAFECLCGERYVPPAASGHFEIAVIMYAVANASFEARVGVLRTALLAPEPEGRGIDPHRARPLIELLGSMLAPQKEDRPASAAVLAHRLEDLADAWKPHLGRRYLRTAVEGLLPPITDPGAVAARSQVELTLSERDRLEKFKGAVKDGAADPTRMAPRGAREEPPSPMMRVVALAIVGAVILTLGIVAMLNPRKDPPANDPPPAVVAAVLETSEAPPDEATPPSPAVTEAAPRAVETAPASVEATLQPVEATPRPVEATPEPVQATPRATPAPRPEPTPVPPADVWPTLRHTVPRPYLFPGSLTLNVRLEGGNVDCEPEVLIRPVMVTPISFNGQSMQNGGTSVWSVTMAFPYGERWSVGAEYYIRCCDSRGGCGAGLRNGANPFLVEPATF
jgi:serine/threonine-protein kinase